MSSDVMGPAGPGGFPTDTISDWQATVHALAREKGWWTPYIAREDAIRELSADQVLSKLMLIVSELAEAAEEACKANFDRDGVYFLLDGLKVPYHEWAQRQPARPKPEGFGIELADAFIRIMDTCGAMGIDLELCFRELYEWDMRMFPQERAAAVDRVQIYEWQKKVSGGQGMPGALVSVSMAFARIMSVVVFLAKGTEEVRQPNFNPRQLYFRLGGVRLAYSEWPQHFAVRPEPEGFGVELAGAVVGIMNVCELAGVDLMYCVREKHEYNKARPARHGGKRA